MRFLQALVFLCVVRPLLMIVIGLNVRGRERLPENGPAIIAANHNSHLDTLTLMSLWPLPALHRIHPAAAADYFLSNSILAWLSLNIMGIIPVERNRTDRTSDPLADMAVALERNDILILFPEGSRGEPEQLSRF
ncbi:MAG: 1-acyl-sn-glycerol-3-phosphate acyltransferase, partial [Caldilineaceae bacterium]|nr:1-acyl-sn-glycerol-3-phosphate acyltransferase [Caldilineaceae bacterium]